MKILCCTYRPWAEKIYLNLRNQFTEHQFVIINTREEMSYDDIERIHPDIILWYGWSWIIPDYILQKYFSVMLHPSPLPKYRGGSPIQNQIVNGDTSSAVTLFKMDRGIDTGDIILQESFEMDGELSDILDSISSIGTKLSKSMIENFANIDNIMYKQNEDLATYYPRRTPKQSEITIDEIKEHTAEQLYNKIRCLQDPYPNAYIVCKDGTKLYITKSHI